MMVPEGKVVVHLSVVHSQPMKPNTETAFLSCNKIRGVGWGGRETQAFGLTIKTLIKMPMANVGMPVNWKRPLVQPLGSSRDGPSA